MKIIVTGATGLVGAETIREAIVDREITVVTALSRRPPPVTDSKLTHIIHSDFQNFNGLDELFRANDALIWCLGISQTQVNKEEYHRITYDYTIKAAKAIKKANPQMRFIFLSGLGADTTEQSKTLFARVKGKTENALNDIGITELYIARPGGIKPIHKNPDTALSNKIMIPFFPLLQLLKPSAMITSVELAKALLLLAKHGSDKRLHDNISLQNLAKSAR